MKQAASVDAWNFPNVHLLDGSGKVAEIKRNIEIWFANHREQTKSNVMAKQTKSSNTPAAPAAPTNPAAPAEEKGGEDIFRAVFADGKPVEPKAKLAPQAMVIVNTVRAAGKEGVSRKQLNINLKGVLVTKQPESRIVTYYQKKLIESGAIVVDKKPQAPAPAAPATA